MRLSWLTFRLPAVCAHRWDIGSDSAPSIIVSTRGQMAAIASARVLGQTGAVANSSSEALDTVLLLSVH